MVEEPKVEVEIVEEVTDVELLVLPRVMVDVVEIWVVPEVEVDRVVDDCDVAVADVNSIVETVVVGVNVGLIMLSLPVVEAGVEVVGLTVNEVKDDETDVDSMKDVSVKLGISVDVAMEIGVVTAVETGGAGSVEAIVAVVSVGCVIVGTMIVELSICRILAACAFGPVKAKPARAKRRIVHNVIRPISN